MISGEAAQLCKRRGLPSEVGSEAKAELVVVGLVAGHAARSHGNGCRGASQCGYHL